MSSAITLARLAAEARSLPTRNPGYPTDALLIYADALTEAAVELAASDRPGGAPALREIAENARAMSRLHAAATTTDAEAATRILRREG